MVLTRQTEQLAEYMIKTGLVRRLKKITALPDERVQLQIAKIISNLSAFGTLHGSVTCMTLFICRKLEKDNCCPRMVRAITVLG